MILIENISSISILPAIIIGLVFYKHLQPNFKILFYLAAYAGIIELYNWIVVPDHNKYLAIMVWCSFELTTIVFFLGKSFKVDLNIYLIPWTIAYCILIYQTDALNVFNPGLRLMMSAPLVLLSTWGLYQSVKNKDLAVGIVSLGFLLYFCSTIPVFLYYNDLNRSIWVLHSAFNILMNLLIGLGFHVYTRTIRTDLKDIRDRRSVSVDRGDLAGL